MNKILFTNVLFNNTCLICKNRLFNTNIRHLCNECSELFNPEMINPCPICAHPLDITGRCISCTKLGTIYYDKYFFLQYYTPFFKTLIMKLKKEENFIVNRIFHDLLISKNIIDKDSVITVVPDSFYRRIRKGRSSLHYLLTLLKKSGYTTLPDVYLRKYAFNNQQKNKSASERIFTIKNMFYLKKKYKNKCKGKVTLIDDIYTTGATLNYGAKLLKEAGFEHVTIISFFRARLIL